MEYVKIKYKDIQSVITEISLFLEETITLENKYWLIKYLKYLNEQKEILDEIFNDLIKKYGTTSESGETVISIYKPGTEKYNENNEFISGDENENYILFVNEYNKLLEIDIIFEIQLINIENIKDIKTSKPYLFILNNLVK